MDLHRAGVVGTVAVLPLVLFECIAGSFGFVFWTLPALIAPWLATKADPRWRLMAQGAWWSVLVAAAAAAQGAPDAVEVALGLVASLGSAAALVLSRYDVAEAQRRAGRAPRDFGATLATATVAVSVLGMWFTAASVVMLMQGGGLSTGLIFMAIGAVFLGAAWLIASGRGLGFGLALSVPWVLLLAMTLRMASRSEPIIIDFRPVLLVPFAVVAAPMLPLLLAFLPRARRPRVPRRLRLGVKWLAVSVCLAATLHGAITAIA